MKITLMLAGILLCFCVQAQQLAFPGAEGYGRFSTGGRTGTVYHVTNLNDSGSGSFRDAVSQPNRIVVFDVAGVIHVQSRVVVKSNITVAGQTAPGDGVVIYGDGISTSGANDVIIRYLRVRMGRGGTSGKDAIGVANGTKQIFDHVSTTWGRDETFSISWDGKGTEPGDITIQNCIIGQGLFSHSCGGLIQTSNGVSILRTLYVDNHTRNPKVKGLNQFENNVVYNWGGGGCYILGDTEAPSWATIVNNYFIKGPNTTVATYTRANSWFQLYASGNYVDGNLDGVLNGELSVQADYGPVTWIENRSDFANLTGDNAIPKMHPEVTELLSAEEAYQLIVEQAGASLPTRDQVDLLLIDELKSLGTEGEIISDELDLPTAGPGHIYQSKRKQDTDGDGMPDEWENANGTDPNVDDAMVLAANNYANIENYINSISEATVFLKYPIKIQTADKTYNTIDLSWTLEETAATALILEYGTTENDFLQSLQLGGDVTAAQLTGLQSGTSYYIRLKSKNSELESEYSEVVKIDTEYEPTVPIASVSLSPADGGSLNFFRDVTLNWENNSHSVGGALSYDLYFGTSPETMELLAESTSETSFSVGELQAQTSYYWKVVATNNVGTTETAFSFSTVEEIERTKLCYFPFDESNGNIAENTVADFDATATNFQPIWDSGAHSNCVVFPAAGDRDDRYFSVPHYDAMSLGSKSFTISLWFKSDGSVSNSYLLHKGMHNADYGGNGNWVGIEYKNGSLYFGVDDNVNKSLVTINDASDYFNNEWHHIACVRDTEVAKIRMFMDGEMIGEADDQTGAIIESDALIIGNCNGAFNTPFPGKLDELIFFEGALSAPEISYLSRFEATAPEKSSSPSPGIEASLSFFRGVDLSWENTTIEEGGPLTYDVYFGTSENSMTKVAEGISENTCSVGDLEPETTYYWQVSASNSLGETEGDLWSFSTETESMQTELLHLHFNEENGTTAENWAGENNASAANFSPVWESGKVGNCIRLSGNQTNGYMAVDHYSALDMGTRSFTISLWFRSEGAMPDSYLLQKGMHDDTNGGNGNWFGIQYKDSKLYFGVDDNVTKSLVTLSGADSYFDNQWHHLACIRDEAETKLKLYVDGQLLEEADDGTGNITESGQLIIGNRNGYFDNPYIGCLDDLIIFDGVLSDVQISFIANNLAMGIDNRVLVDGEMGIFPNPFDDFVQLDLSNVRQAKGVVEIMDLSGRVKFRQTYDKAVSEQAVMRGLGSLPKGIYVCIIKTEEGIYAEKLIKN